MEVSAQPRGWALSSVRTEQEAGWAPQAVRSVARGNKTPLQPVVWSVCPLSASVNVCTGQMARLDNGQRQSSVQVVR
jgi:hypothetical protein